TAPQCGRVGRRLFSTAVFQEKSWETVFLYVYTALFLPLLTALISLIGIISLIDKKNIVNSSYYLGM
nr:hypothetical protein [Bacteroidaceae bacterium]